jgi:hypothetical protein
MQFLFSCSLPFFAYQHKTLTTQSKKIALILFLSVNVTTFYSIAKYSEVNLALVQSFFFIAPFYKINFMAPISLFLSDIIQNQPHLKQSKTPSTRWSCVPEFHFEF